MNIIVKNYQHYNRALGKYISTKKQYDEEMRKGGYVSFEEGERLAELARGRDIKKYDGLSTNKMRFLNRTKDRADKNGNIRVDDGFVKDVKENSGIKLDINYDKLPKHYQGGFSG
jgi:hypothetical protein